MYSKKYKKIQTIFSIFFTVSLLFSVFYPAITVFAEGESEVLEVTETSSEVAEVANEDSSDSVDSVVTDDVSEVADVTSDVTEVSEEEATIDPNLSAENSSESSESEKAVIDTTDTANSADSSVSSSDNSSGSSGVGLMMMSASSVTDAILASPVASNFCATPNPIDGTNVTILNLHGDKTLQAIINDAGYQNDTAYEQRHYQTWSIQENNSVTFSVEFLDQNAAGGNVFGYYLNGDFNSFVPIFKSGASPNTLYPNAPVLAKGEMLTFTVPASTTAQYVTFAINAEHVEDGLNLFISTKDSENLNDMTQVLSYDARTTAGFVKGSYILGFEDLLIGDSYTNSLSDQDFNDVSVVVKETGCEYVPPSINTAPIISLIGSNPMTVYAGSTFIDPEASSTDAEDGNLTSKIVKTGTVDTNTTGTYTITYSVTDSGGLKASVTRTVFVVSLPNTICAIPDSLSDGIKVSIYNLHDEKITLQTMLDSVQPNTDKYYDQKTYQAWNTIKATTTIEVEYLDYGGSPIVFGYHKKGDLNSFVPVFKNGNYTGYESIPTLSKGQKISFDIYNISNVVFAIKSQDAGSPMFSTENSMNGDGFRHAAAYDFFNQSYQSYLLGFEDLAGLGDSDYNDIFVKVSFTGCKGENGNTPPKISLVGSNPIKIDVGDPFNDPGATAIDTEDGDLTSKIIRSGSVNASLVGTYTITYSVTDSGGLSASTTRTVIVSSGGGGDNGGGGGGGGHRHKKIETTACYYLIDYLKIDWQNDPVEVLKLQSFLNVFEGENLSYTGVYDEATFAAVQRFQLKYSNDILTPWGDKVTTGFVYILTKKKVNEIYCNSEFPLNQAQQGEIDDFKSSGTSTYGQIGYSGSSSSGTFATESAGDDSGSSNMLSNNVIVVDLENDNNATSSATTTIVTNDSALRNAAVSLFALPKKVFSDWKYFLSFIILIAIAIVTVQLVREGDDQLEEEIKRTNFDEDFVKDKKTETPDTIILPGVFPDEEIVVDSEQEQEIANEIPESKKAS